MNVKKYIINWLVSYGIPTVYAKRVFESLAYGFKQLFLADSVLMYQVLRDSIIMTPIGHPLMNKPHRMRSDIVLGLMALYDFLGTLDVVKVQLVDIRDEYADAKQLEDGSEFVAGYYSLVAYVIDKEKMKSMGHNYRDLVPIDTIGYEDDEKSRIIMP